VDLEGEMFVHVNMSNSVTGLTEWFEAVKPMTYEKTTHRIGNEDIGRCLVDSQVCFSTYTTPIIILGYWEQTFVSL
jgi:hypothetical protein